MQLLHDPVKNLSRGSANAGPTRKQDVQPPVAGLPDRRSGVPGHVAGGFLENCVLMYDIIVAFDWMEVDESFATPAPGFRRPIVSERDG
jgi:hypothetical protein